MKIKCQYCGTMIEDTLDKCPNCGGPNLNVVRTANDTPKTIEELKKWYSDRGLPPYETTRFFIGEDYTKPRAFGIYKDSTGNYVVYKNKDSGERAIRYKGTDEAYAVNELYMRLKQEIIQQKSNALKKNTSISGGNSAKKGKGIFGNLFGLVGLVSGCGIGMFAIIMVFGLIIGVVENLPENGYYSYNGKAYYYDYSGSHWFETDNENWSETPLRDDDVPAELRTGKESKPYYLSYDWNDNLNMPDFKNSTYYIDSKNPAQTGYYSYNGKNYYNMTGDYASGWYYYDDDYDWVSVNEADVPYDLSHYQTSQDFFYTSTWDASTQVSDFEDTEIYEEYQEELQSYESDSSDYDWDSSDSWDSDSSDWGSDW